MRGKGKGNVLAAKRSQLQARRHNLQLGSGTAQHNKKQENNNGREKRKKVKSRNKRRRRRSKCSVAFINSKSWQAPWHFFVAYFSAHAIFHCSRCSNGNNSNVQPSVAALTSTALTKCPLKGVASRPDALTVALALWPPTKLDWQYEESSTCPLKISRKQLSLSRLAESQSLMPLPLHCLPAVPLDAVSPLCTPPRPSLSLHDPIRSGSALFALSRTQTNNCATA